MDDYEEIVAMLQKIKENKSLIKQIKSFIKSLIKYYS